MRVLHLIPGLQKGGAERLCLDMVRALRTQPGVKAAEVAILAPRNEYADEYPDIRPSVLQASVTPSISGKWQVNLQEWEQLLHTFRPTVIHTHLFAAELLARYRPLRGITYVSHCHDNMHQLAPLKPREWFNKKRLTEAYERRFMLRQYQKVDNRFVAISRDTETYFKAVLPAGLAARVAFLPNAVDVSRYAQKTAVPPAAGEPIRLVNVGSFVAKKNQAFLLDVLAELKKTGTPVHLHLVGDGPLHASVREKASRMGLADDVTFCGKMSHVETLLWNSHIYVHSATYEPFGLVLVEAMAAGLPVVCLDGYGNRDLIREGENGFMVKERDPKIFADKIGRLGRDEKLHSRMGKYAMQFARRFDITDYAKNLLTLYAS